MVMVDRCHAAGFIRLPVKGTKVMGRVDIITGTLGKALGGAMGGYTAKKRNN
jgi:glycine C-acetyltransferase